MSRYTRQNDKLRRQPSDWLEVIGWILILIAVWGANVAAIIWAVNGRNAWGYVVFTLLCLFGAVALVWMLCVCVISGRDGAGQ